PQAVTVSAIASSGTDASPWPYAAERPALSTAIHNALRMIPFFARANRGPARMRVFLPESPLNDTPCAGGLRWSGAEHDRSMGPRVTVGSVDLEESEGDGAVRLGT